MRCCTTIAPSPPDTTIRHLITRLGFTTTARISSSGVVNINGAQGCCLCCCQGRVLGDDLWSLWSIQKSLVSAAADGIGNHLNNTTQCYFNKEVCLKNIVEHTRSTESIKLPTVNGSFVYIHNHALIESKRRDHVRRANAFIGSGRETCNYGGLTNNFNLVNMSGLMDAPSGLHNTPRFHRRITFFFNQTSSTISQALTRSLDHCSSHWS